MPLERQPVSLPRLAQSVMQQMRPLAEREGVALQLQTAPQLPAVDADYALISRVLVNLVDNALKHSPSGGTVTIKITPESADLAEPATVSPVEPAGQAVRCTVLDVGPGIPVEHRETIFERFAQLGGRRRGAGLGLTFCQLTVQAHGGRIWVEGNPEGQGSAFHFTLPVVPVETLAMLDHEAAA